MLPDNQKLIFLDTVGFLHKLPHHLVEAFKSTLEEVKMADVLIHVLDASSRKVHEQEEAVYNVLKGLNAENKIIINVLNKIDLVDNPDTIKRLKKDFKNAVLLSALKGDGIDALINEISDLLLGSVVEIKIEIPNNRMDRVNLIYENGRVNYREDRAGSVYIEAVVPLRLKSLLSNNFTL